MDQERERFRPRMPRRTPLLLPHPDRDPQLPGLGIQSEAPASQAAEARIPTMQIFTLGRFDVLLLSTIGQQTRPAWETRQACLVLKCLLAAPHGSLSRDQLMEALWPEQSLTQAYDSLRHSLSRLRRALEPDRLPYAESSYIGSDRGAIWLRLDNLDALAEGTPRLWIDYRRFEALAERALATLGLGRASLGDRSSSVAVERRAANEALTLYRGPFLAGEAHLEWTHARRQRMHSLWVTLVRSRATQAVVEQALDLAALLFGELLHADPEDEDAVGRLMCLEAALGHRGEAMRVYDHLVARLAATLGTQPTRELQDLAVTIRTSPSQQELRLLLVQQFVLT